MTITLIRFNGAVIVAAALVCSPSAFLSVRAQKPKSKDPIVLKPATTPEEDPEKARRRSIAQGALNTLAIEARSYRDEALRARVQARVADALWDVEPENARNLFRRAWEAAEAFETQSTAPGQTVPGRFSPNRTNAGSRPRTNLRTEILKLASTRDNELGEEFLKKLTGASEERTESKTSLPSSAEIRERLRLANDFLELKNVARALQFADPALVEITRSTISFLVALREQDAPSADRRFATLLGRAGADPASDANTVSLLIRYAFTPWIDLAVSPGGTPSSFSYPPSTPPNLDPPLRAAVLKISADILLRPFAQLEQSSAGRAGTYFMASRLMPLFQQHAPDLVPALNAQLTALGPEAARASANAGDRSLNRGLTTETAGIDVAGDLKDRLDRARTADERDRAYAFAAMGAADTGDLRAFEFVNKIEDLATQRGIKTFVEYSLIQSYLKKKQIDEALQLARKSEISNALRAHVLTEAGALISKSDAVRARELFEEALTETRRVNAGSSERAYLLISLLSQYAKVDRVRAWELVDETIKAGNAAPNFTGENANARWTLEGKFSIAMSTQLAGPGDLDEAFAVLARDDFYRAMDAARNFSGEAPQALVTIAVARAVLEDPARR